MKNLANQAAKATEEISSQISTVQKETRHAVDAIRDIAVVIDQVREIFSGIASAVEEQGAATQKITRNVQEAAVGTQDVTSNITGISRAADESVESSTQILTASNDLARSSETLSSEVYRLLSEVRAG